MVDHMWQAAWTRGARLAVALLLMLLLMLLLSGTQMARGDGPWWGGWPGDWYGGPPYGIYYEPHSGYRSYYLPPIYAPAELAYGPQAVKPMLGVSPEFGLAPLRRSPDDALLDLLAEHLRKAAAPRRDPPLVARPTNAATRTLARRHREFGDQRFRLQEYSSAVTRYRTAAELAPDVAENWYHLALAWTALGKTEHAAAAFRRGLALDPDWPHGFRLDDLYAGKGIAKTAQLETLGRLALANPERYEPLLAVGMLLHLDGHPERAAALFRQAARLAGDSAPEIDTLLRRAL